MGGQERDPHVVNVACPANCYAKVVEAVAKTQNDNTQSKLDSIIDNQTSLIKGVNQVIEVIANLTNLKEQFEEHKVEADKSFNQLYERVRKVELKLAWFVGATTAIVGTLEILRLLKII